MLRTVPKLAEVSDTSVEGWRSFAVRHGTTQTALAEVIGLYLADLQTPTHELPEPLRSWVGQARELAASRRRRRFRRRSDEPT